MIHFILGGERSGKSNYAMQLARSFSSHPIYVATARRWDADFEKRIDKHRGDRGDEWITIEEEKCLGRLNLDGKVAVIDCITLWLTNYFMDNEGDIVQSIEEVKKEIDALNRKQSKLIIVSNEIGMGSHASTESGRKFTELQGLTNQYVASKAEEVTLMVAGIPVKLK